MIQTERFYITDDNKAEIETEYGPIEKLTDKDAEEIVCDMTGREVTYASFSDDESIYYQYEDGEYEDEVPRGWTEEYLNSIGMSMKDFY